MEDQDGNTADLGVGIPPWVGALAIRQCVRAGEHDRDHPTACSTHLREALRRAAWLEGGSGEPDWSPT